MTLRLSDAEVSTHPHGFEVRCFKCCQRMIVHPEVFGRLGDEFFETCGCATWRTTLMVGAASGDRAVLTFELQRVVKK